MPTAPARADTNGLNTKHTPADPVPATDRRERPGTVGTVAVVDGGDDALDGIERWFVDRGLPHFVERHDTAAEIWGRALPLLIVAYLLLGLNALDIWEWSLAKNLVVAAFVVVGAVVTWVVANLVRGRGLVRAAPPHRPGRAGRVHDRARRAVAARRPVGRRRQDGRPWRSASSPLLWAITSYGVPSLLRLGRGSARTAQLAAAAQRRRPGPAAAAAVHDVPVHQRRGLAGRRHADRRRVRRHAGHLLRPRRVVRPVPGAGADARAEPLRLVGPGRRRSPPTPRPRRVRRRAGVARRDAGASPAGRRCASGSTSASSRSSPRRSRSRSSALALTAFFVLFGFLAIPEDDDGGLDDARPGARARQLVASAARRWCITEPLIRVVGLPRRVHGDVLHRPALDRRHLPRGVR